ncbi:MAG: diguanylate cyclase [Moorellales bacterium]
MMRLFVFLRAETASEREGGRELRLILATGHDRLNEHIRASLPRAHIRECLYREALLEEAVRQRADVVVLAEYLPGSAELVQLAKELRYLGCRVVFIVDGPPGEDKAELAMRLISAGVYDLVFAPAPFEAVTERIRKPADLRWAVDVSGLTRRFVSREGLERLTPLREEGGSSAGGSISQAEAAQAGCAEEGLAWEEGPWEAGEERGDARENSWAETFSQPGEGPVGEESGSAREDAGLKASEGPACPADHAEEGPAAEIYVLGAEAVPRGAAGFQAREELFDALARRKPRAIVLAADFPGCVDLVRELRSYSRLWDVAIGVLGPPDARFFAAGADDCFEALDEEAAARLLARRERLAALWQEARTDALTGLYARRCLEPWLEEGFRVWRASGVPFSVVMLDLDRFKKVNDVHGHAAGDEVLRRLGDHLRKSLRERDAAFRYGGEEVVLFLAGADLEEAVRIAERLRRGWEALDVFGSTFSAGAAQAGLHGEDAESLLAAADRALYAAKAAGRNRVAAAGGAETAAPEGRPVSRPERAPARIVAVASPVPGAGASAVAALLAKELAKKRKVAAVDCDLFGRGLGVRMGLAPHVAGAYDWRKTDLPVWAGKVAVRPLDPGANGLGGEPWLAVRAAAWDAEAVVADLGAEPDRRVLEEADILFWVLRDEPAFLERALARWQTRPKPKCLEALVLYGRGSTRALEEAFALPCFRVAGPEDRRGAALLVRAALSPGAGRGVRVLAVGYRKVPEVRGVAWVPFPDARSAGAWLARHRPDMAALRPGMRGAELLEADLRRAGVPVYRIADLAEIEKALGA